MKNLRSSAAAAALILAAASSAAGARPPVEEPKLLANGWHYGEAGNYCMAIRRLDSGARLMMRLAKWNDLSDSLILSAPGLAPLDEEDEAAAQRGYDIAVRIDGRAVELLPNVFMLEDFEGAPGPSWRIGVMPKPFIAALAKGKVLEILRSGQLAATFPIARSAGMAKSFASCVEKPPSF